MVPLIRQEEKSHTTQQQPVLDVAGDAVSLGESPPQPMVSMKVDSATTESDLRMRALVAQPTLPSYSSATEVTPTIPSLQDWLIDYVNGTAVTTGDFTSGASLIQQHISGNTVGRDLQAIIATIIVRRRDGKRELLQLKELQSLLDELKTRIIEKHDIRALSSLLNLSREYRTTQNLQQAIFCYVIVDILNGTLQIIKTGELHKEIVTCCQDLAKVLRDDLLLHRFTSLNNIEVVKFLLNNKDILAIDINALATIKRTTALNIACEQGLYTITELLLSQGADITVGGTRETCLYAACKKGYRKIVSLLIQQPSIREILDLPNRSDNDSRDTALHIAVKEGHFSIARMLIDKGADITLKNILEYTVLWELICSYESGNIQEQDKLACLLLERHHDFKRDFNDYLLKQTVCRGLEQFFATYCFDLITKANILMLIEAAGLNIIEGRFSGLTKITYKHAQSCKQILLFILGKAKKLAVTEQEKQESILGKWKNFSGNILCYAASHGQADIVSLILADYPGCERLVFDRRIALHFAVENEIDDIKVVKMLLAKTPDLINVHAEDGCALLHRSVRYANVEVTRYLLKSGASPNLETQDREKDVPITVVAKACSSDTPFEQVEKFVKICELLVTYGANLSQGDSHGNTALQIQEAMRGGGQEKLIVLLKSKYCPKNTTLPSY